MCKVTEFGGPSVTLHGYGGAVARLYLREFHFTLKGATRFSPAGAPSWVTQTRVFSYNDLEGFHRKALS